MEWRLYWHIALRALSRAQIRNEIGIGNGSTRCVTFSGFLCYCGLLSSHFCNGHGNYVTDETTLQIHLKKVWKKAVF